MTTGDGSPGLLDLGRLGRWMDSKGLPGAGEPIRYERVTGGTQNEIFEIRRGNLHCALRRPPLNPPPGRNEGILREWRIIEALDGTDVPHTRAVALGDDPSVLGCTFYLMGFVDGWSPASISEWPDPFNSDQRERRGLASELVSAIAKLSLVDWKTKGLVDLGRPDGFHDRQVDRWMSFFERVKTREVPGLDEAAQWLRGHRPLDFIPGLMHGDYQFANVMYRHGSPARLEAIVDWEMGTIGDPKLDLAWVLQDWPEDASDTAGRGHLDRSGMPTRSELVELYATESRRQVDDIDYYLVLARWKYGIVLEQGYSRAVQGMADNERLLGFGAAVTDLMERAANLAASSDYRG